MNSYKLSDFDFDFPKELIASRTAGKGKQKFFFAQKMDRLVPFFPHQK